MRAAVRIGSRVLSWLLLATVVAAGLALIAVPKANDAKPLTVLSGSMAPTYDPGDVVVVGRANATELKVGDVITFQAESGDPQLTTHRVVAVSYGSEGISYVTQGDANDAPDVEPVRPAQVRGEVWYSVPRVGYLSVWIASGWLGDVVDWVAVGLVLYGAAQIVVGLVRRRRQRRETSGSADAQALGNGVSVAG